MDKKYFAFKKLFWSYLFSSLAFGLVVGFLSIIDIVPVYFNEKPYFGGIGFLLAITFTPFIAFVLSITNFLALNLGVFLIRFFCSQKRNGTK